MTRGLALVVGGILLFVAILALAGVGMSGQVRVGVLAVTVAGIAGILWWDNRREKKEKEQVAADNEKRFAELSAQAERPQFELVVTGSSQVALALIVALLCAAVLFAGISMERIWYFLGGLLLLGPAVLLLLQVIPAIGAPLVVITRSGFKTPQTPQLPWKLIDGIYLHKIVMRGSVSYHLVFQIGSLPQIIGEFGLFHRVMYRLARKAGKTRFWFDLRGSNEKPEVIYRVMRLLWNKSTGRDYDWDPNMSEDYNAALRKMKESTDRMNHELKSGVASPRGPAEVARVMKEMDANSAVVAKELQRKARGAKWGQFLLGRVNTNVQDSGTVRTWKLPERSTNKSRTACPRNGAT